MREFKRRPYPDMGVDEVPVSASARQVGGNHYKDMAIQPSEFIHKNGLNWCEGSAIKYLCRHNLKGGLEDLLKARHYIDLLIEWEYNGAGQEDGQVGDGEHIQPGNRQEEQ